MTRRQRNIAVEAHADRILANRLSAEAYAAHFETQMRSGRVRRLLYTTYLWLARAGAILMGLEDSYVH